MLEVANKFAEFLQKKDLKLTRQREEILHAFLNTGRHLSVEELYDIVKKKDPKIGLATVFRTSKLLRDAGIASEIALGDKIVRYEYKSEQKQHDHLICLKCGEFIEAVEPKIEEIQDSLCKKYGFFPQRHKMYIFGLCKKCKDK